MVGRADVGAALFFLLSLQCYVRHCGLRRNAAHGTFDTRLCGSSSVSKCWGWMLGSLWCAAASMLWKEQGVTVLAVSAAYDLFVFQRLRFRQALLLLLGKVNECTPLGPVCVFVHYSLGISTYPLSSSFPQRQTPASCYWFLYGGLRFVCVRNTVLLVWKMCLCLLFISSVIRKAVCPCKTHMWCMKNQLFSFVTCKQEGTICTSSQHSRQLQFAGANRCTLKQGN